MKRILLIWLVIYPTLFAYDRALPGFDYEFPRDHFEHPSFQTEWWYYTGNLETTEGRRFGFELTFFRHALREESERGTVWGVRDVYLAHLALTDLRGRRFFKEQRRNRGGPGLAGSSLEGSRLWNGNWEVRWLDLQDPLGAQRLSGVGQDFALDLTLTPRKPPVVHGLNGVSQKAEAAGRASHYVSFTRLEVQGRVALHGTTHEVKGSAWMDHEFFTESMAADQIGWDWASVQLDNNTELMIYRLRRAGATVDVHSSGTFIDAQGGLTHLNWDDLMMEPEGDVWTSPATAARYPLRWKIGVPSLGLELVCSTPFREQEVVSEGSLTPNYWEGAVDYEGSVGGAPVTGKGYLELTGYDKPVSLGGP